MKIYYSALTFLVCFFMISCGDNTTKQESTTKNAEGMNTAEVGVEVDAAKLATMKDVVCGMSMANVAITDTAIHNGKVYPFCAKVCKDMFQKNRVKYVIN